MAGGGLGVTATDRITLIDLVFKSVMPTFGVEQGPSLVHVQALVADAVVE